MRKVLLSGFWLLSLADCRGRGRTGKARRGERPKQSFARNDRASGPNSVGALGSWHGPWHGPAGSRLGSVGSEAVRLRC